MKMGENADGYRCCTKCQSDKFKNHPDLYGYLSCDGCGTIYPHPWFEDADEEMLKTYRSKP